jgi:uncharacterized protein YoxC
MTFSERFSTGQINQGPPQEPQGAPPGTEELRHRSDTIMNARRITGQVAPGDPIPQPAAANLTGDQGLIMLAQSIAVMAAQLTRITNALEAMEKRQARELEALQAVSKGIDNLAENVDDIRENVHGFTDEGASFRSSVTDPFTAAYAAVVAPMLAIRCRNEVDGKLIPELLKAGAAMARDMVDEIAAFREQRPAQGALEAALGSDSDPWGGVGQ